MRRREFIAGLGGAAVWPLATSAQQQTRPVIGFLGALSASDWATRVEALRAGLRTYFTRHAYGTATFTDFLAALSEAAGTDLASEQTLGAERDEVLQCVIQANLKLQEYDQERTNFLARTVRVL